jgi:hypothetical protein
VHYEIQHLEQKMKLPADGIKSVTTRLCIVSVFLVLLVQWYLYKPWNKNQVFMHDAQEYYAFVPAFFIYGDINFNYFNKAGNETAVRPPLFETKNGFTVKRSIGQAVLYTPWFLPAWAYYSIKGHPATGYERGYQIAVSFGALMYAFLALLLLASVLSEFIGPTAVCMTLVSVFLATNLYYYTAIHGVMTHVHSFFLFALFIWLTMQWYKKPGYKYSAAIGFTLGLITIVRPTNIIIALLFLCWQPELLKYRIKLYLTHFRKILLLTAVSFIPILLQISIWKHQTGEWIYYSYGNEKFFFNDPEIIKGLFSFRNGLFPYAPVLLLAIPGLLFMFTKKNPLRLALIVLLPLNFYIIYSWWCWWYGGALGARAAIESYVLLAFPLGHVYQKLSQNNISRAITGGLITLFVILNLVNTRWFTEGLLHYDAMTQRTYFNLLKTGKQPPLHYDSMLEPDYEGAMTGEEQYHKWNKLTPENPYSNTIIIENPTTDSLQTTIEFGIFSSLKFPEQTLWITVSAFDHNSQNTLLDATPLGPETIGNRGWNSATLPINIKLPENTALVKIYLHYTGAGEAYYRKVKMPVNIGNM